MIEEYENFEWSTQGRTLHDQINSFDSIVRQAKESDVYIDWQEQKKKKKAEILELKSDFMEIKHNKMEIILRNS